MKTELRKLLVPLTDKERDEASKNLAQASIDEEAMEAEKKNATKVLGQRLKEIRNERRSLSRKIRLGAECQVKCRAEVDHKSKRLLVTRLDTGEIVEDRDATPDELGAAAQGVLYSEDAQ